MKPKQPAPDGTLSLLDQERALCLIASEMEAKARVLLASSDGDRIAAATSKEFYLGAIRARRQASVLCEARERRAHIEMLVEERARMSGGDRPRLRKKAP